MSVSIRLQRTLEDRILEYIRAHPARELTVYVSDDSAPVERILSLPHVTSIILPQRNEELAAAHSGRVGWIDYGGGEYRYPERLGDTIWRWNSSTPLSVPTVLYLSRRNVSTFVYATSTFTTSVGYSVWQELVRAYRYNFHIKLRFNKVFGRVGECLEQRIDESLWRRRFKRLFRNVVRLEGSSDAGAHSGIILITNSLGPGGAERQLVNTAIGLKSLHNERVQVLCLSSAHGTDLFYSEWLTREGIEVIYLPDLPDLPLERDLDVRLSQLWAHVGPSDGIVENLARITMQLVRSKPRVVHCWLDSPNIAGGCAALLARVPRTIISTHSFSPIHFAWLQPYMRPGYRKLSEHPGIRFSNNSAAGAKDYAHWLGISATRIAVVRNGVDTREVARPPPDQIDAYRRQLGLTPSDLIVGTICRLTEEKRPLLWVQTAQLIARRRNDVKFIMIGDGPMYEKVIELAKGAKLCDRFITPGLEKSIALPLAVIDCFLLTSRLEGLPNVLLEAQSVGIPVVTAKVGGTAEAIEEGRSGWAIEGHDPESYAQCILDLFSDHSRRDAAARTGPEFVASRFSLQQMISKTAELYESSDSDSTQIMSLLSSSFRSLAFMSALRKLARRTLPEPARHLLVRYYFRVEGLFKGSVQKRFRKRPMALSLFRPICEAGTFADGPILMVNNALASGGVERQIVNSLRILERQTKHRLGLLCLRLGDAPDLDFFKPALAGFGGFVRNAVPSPEAELILRGAPNHCLVRIRKSIAWMPRDVQEEILRLAAEFIKLKPAVVHAWQESVGISATYAAKLVGVPRILLSTRNVRPTNFAWYRPYMELAHQEIVRCPDIVIINNSEAGAIDYAKWLQIPVSRFVVKRNGFDMAGSKRSDAATLARLRAKLDIAEHAPIVGSIFRFYQEKRPLLWVAVAGKVAARLPQAHFVVFGDGPLVQASVALANKLGIGDKFHTPGTIADAMAGLSLFDVFLLTSQFEGTPNVVLEASALGVPVVATEAGGTREAIDQDVTGYLVNSVDPGEIADRIVAILADANWRLRVRSEGPAFVERRFGLGRMFAETLELYKMPPV